MKDKKLNAKWNEERIWKQDEGRVKPFRVKPLVCVLVLGTVPVVVFNVKIFSFAVMDFSVETEYQNESKVLTLWYES